MGRFFSNFDFSPSKIARNRPIVPRILTFFPRKSREIGRFFREFAPENPAKFCFFFREISEALITRFSFPLFRMIHYHSLLTKVSHGKRKMIGKRQTSAGLRRILLCSHRPRLWSKLPGFQNWFRLRWNVRALKKVVIARTGSASCIARD